MITLMENYKILHFILKLYFKIDKLNTKNVMIFPLQVIYNEINA